MVETPGGDSPVNTKHLYNIYTTTAKVGPTLYKCYTNVFCLLGHGFTLTLLLLAFGELDLHPKKRQHHTCAIYLIINICM